ncbi:MAG: T9SS type A sorting domain-containing protein [Bacteroidales bacterium]|nr:T9SS type A sorting domain-containing protein [Bacteroidales bacterium]
MTEATAATNPNNTGDIPEEATIAASDILYWVGEGSNQVVMAVNWADTALAWGYRFNGTKTVNDMMNDIATADPRFSYTMDGYYLNDINFNDGSRTLTITPGKYWSSSNNGIMDAGMSQTLANGDFEKWADPAAGIIVDSTYDETYHYWWYTYVYPMAINAVSQPAAMGPFCGVVGTTGCTAIAYNDNRIKAWATGCTLVLGSQNLSDPSAPVVTYGTADEAVGAASTSTMDVVSLGDGGSATLTFEKPIANGDGYDFAVFENSFNDYFLELAFVEVSSDGERFVRFPATSLTQTARQITSSVDPTYINNLAGKYRVGYGTPFDLNELRDSAGLDINNITHVRVIDVVGSIDPELGTYDAFGHIINDPFPTITYSAGFDLDGIAVLNQKTERIELAENGVQMSVYPNPATDRICVTLENLENIDATLFDMSGRAVKTLTLRNGDNTIDISTLQNGIYLIRVAGSVTKIVKK